MTTPPERSGSSLFSRGVPLVLVLVLAVGAGMYFLGRRSRTAAPASGQTSQNAPGTTTSNAGSPNDGTSHQTNGRRFAPHDTFYLLQYVSAKTPTGVMGFEPGQEVHLVEVHQPTQTLVVGDGQAQVEVGPDKLTNDLDVAAMVRQKDESNQAKIAAYVQSEQKAYEEAQREAATKTEQALTKLDQEKQVEKQQAATVAANTASRPSQDKSPVGSGGTKLDEPPVEVGGTGGYGYGYNGSAYYGSPYSYFSGSTTGVTTGARTGTSTSAGRGGSGRR